MKGRWIYSIILFQLLVLVSSTRVSQVSTIVQTENGKIRGIETPDHIEWRGIQFAASTAGKNRWESPSSPLHWNGTQDGGKYGASCPQNCPISSLYCNFNASSEDCLYLNIWSPKPQKEMNNKKVEKRGLLAVTFIIPGSQFKFADASARIYTQGGASKLANTSNTIIVIANYRVGPLGFLVTGDKIVGNYGVMDQIKALEWVNRNIKAFGGDAGRIRVIGHSFGALTARIISNNPKTKNIISSVILQSPCLGASLHNMEEAKNWGAVLGSNLKCSIDDETCLRSKDFREIVKAGDDVLPFISGVTWKGSRISIPWGPVKDGNLVSKNFDYLNGELLDESNTKTIPIIIGTVAEEARIFVYRYINESLHNYEYISILTALFGENTLKILKKYTPDYYPLSDNRDLLSKLFTEYYFTCPARKFAEKEEKKKGNIFLYEFDHITQRPFNTWLNEDSKHCNYHVCNGAEMEYLYHPYSTFSNTEKKLSSSFISIWSNFVNNLNPNGKSSKHIHWPIYNLTKGTTEDEIEKEKSYLRLDTPLSIQQDLRGDECDFWETIQNP